MCAGSPAIGATTAAAVDQTDSEIHMDPPSSNLYNNEPATLPEGGRNEPGSELHMGLPEPPPSVTPVIAALKHYFS